MPACTVRRRVRLGSGTSGSNPLCSSGGSRANLPFLDYDAKNLPFAESPASLTVELCFAAFVSLFLLRPRSATAAIDVVITVKGRSDDVLDHPSHGGPRIERIHASKSSSLNGLVK
jgi:hypothetical protein